MNMDAMDIDGSVVAPRGSKRARRDEEEHQSDTAAERPKMSKKVKSVSLFRV